MKKNLPAVATLIVIILLIAVYRYSTSEKTQKNATLSPTPTTKPESKMTEDLKIEDIVQGNGEVAVSSKKVTVNYKGTLTDGTQFDSSYDRGEPFSFVLGSRGVIEGWDIGVVGMKVGGKRKLTIPPELAYGSRPIGNIPADSTLVFEIELLKVE